MSRATPATEHRHTRTGDETITDTTPAPQAQEEETTPQEQTTKQEETRQKRHEPGEDSRIEEARKYRRRAQKAETERDELAGRLDTATRQLTQARRPIISDRLTRERMYHPEDFETFTGTSPDEYFTPEGDTDQERLDQAIGRLKNDRPELFRQDGLPPAPPIREPWKYEPAPSTSPLAQALTGE